MLFYNLVLIAYLLLVLAVHVASEERTVTSRAFIKLTDVQRVLYRLTIEAAMRVLYNPLNALYFVRLKLFHGIIADFTLEDSHGLELLADFWNSVI